MLQQFSIEAHPFSLKGCWRRPTFECWAIPIVGIEAIGPKKDTSAKIDLKCALCPPTALVDGCRLLILVEDHRIFFNH
jgi:hypothetical protein